MRLVAGTSAVGGLTTHLAAVSLHSDTKKQDNCLPVVTQASLTSQETQTDVEASELPVTVDSEVQCLVVSSGKDGALSDCTAVSLTCFVSWRFLLLAAKRHFYFRLVLFLN